MGKHANADAADDRNDDDEFAEGADEERADHHAARHVAESGHPLEPQAVISPDTHVGVDLSGRPAGAQDAAASPANPDALIERGLVGDGHELE